MKFNQELIQQLREGKIALKTDGDLTEELKGLLLESFPKDVYVKSLSISYFAEQFGETNIIGNNEYWYTSKVNVILPTHLLSDFILSEYPTSAYQYIRTDMLIDPNCKAEKHEHKETEFKTGDLVNVRDDSNDWQDEEAIYVAVNPIKESPYKHIVVDLGTGCASSWKDCRKPIALVTLTHQQIADKFGCTVEQLNIVG